MLVPLGITGRASGVEHRQEGEEIQVTDGAPKVLTARPGREADTVAVTLDGLEQTVRFVVSGAEVGKEVDYLLPLTLFPAMARGHCLRLPGEVSPRLISAVPRIQDIFGLWCTEYWRGNLQKARHVPVDTLVRAGSDLRRGPGVGCLFSGGVDSFYTLLKHRDEITHIIFIHGFDLSLRDRARRAQASRMARGVAEELGKGLIEVETDIRAFSGPVVGWGMYHGAALATVALLFQHLFRKVFVAATYTYSELLPMASHPMLDPLWSTELTEIEHDGCEATRLDKTAFISEHETAMRWLRVCPEGPDGDLNCGRCEKCLRTMITLRIAGAQGRCATLPKDLDLELVSNTYIHGNRLVTQQNLRALERPGTDPELARALEESLRASEAADLETARQLRRRLSLLREELGETRARLKVSRKRTRNLRAKTRVPETGSGKPEGRNGPPADHHPALRYRIADAVVGTALRAPGIRHLAQWRRSTDDGRIS